METSTVTEEPTAVDAVASVPAPTSDNKRIRLAVALAVVFGIWAVAMTVFAISSQGDGGRGEVRGAAISFITTLTTWDAGDGLDTTVESLRDMGTGEFLDQIDEVLGDEARATAEAVGAQSSGEIVEVLLSDIEDDRAVAVIVVNQTLTVDGESVVQEQISRVAFVRIDGKWLVERSELLNSPQVAGAESGDTP